MGRSFFAVCFGVFAVSGLAGCAAPDDAVALNPPGIGQVTGAPAGSLVGATPASLTASFGAPTLRRVDGPAEVWLYHSPTCGLNLILYPDAAGTPRVAEAVPDNNDAAACLLSLRGGGTTVAMERLPAS